MRLTIMTTARHGRGTLIAEVTPGEWQRARSLLTAAAPPTQPRWLRCVDATGWAYLLNLADVVRLGLSDDAGSPPAL